MLKDGGEPPLLFRLEITEAKDKMTGGTQYHIEISVGMKAMVLFNLGSRYRQQNDWDGQKHYLS